MNTNKLKSFSKVARVILLNGVKQRITYWGFDKKGNVSEELISIEGGYMFRESVFNDPTVPKKWEALKSAVKRHTIEDIIEEAAYTWFNRLIAIKILENNNYIEPVYEYVSEQLQDPVILQNARKGETTKLREDEDKLLNEYIKESKDEEAFALLLTAFCRNQKLTNRIFGHIDDYTELLLPNNLLSGGGIIEHINTTDSIEDSDYKEVELIGWLYQFYISDKKDEVFAGFKNKKKARPEDIPAATQIFTPKWIVKYMVENTVGRIWLDLHPDSPIRTDMKYFVEPADKENYKPEPIIRSVTELTLMDPACGSGHILVEGFDLLIKMYLEEGFTTKNAVENIIIKNIYGLDIDDRAAQLANFALLLKAAKYYPAILTTDISPNIYSFPESRDLSTAEVNLFLDTGGMKWANKLKENLDLLQQGKNLGSVIKVEMTEEMRQHLIERYRSFERQYLKDELDLAEKSFWINLKPFIQVMLSLSNKYSSVVANPPYMGQKNMNTRLKDYIENFYPESYFDLMTVFIQCEHNFTKDKGMYSFINIPTWMNSISFKNLRSWLLNYNVIFSLIDLGRGIFGSDFGTVTLSIKKSKESFRGTYFQIYNKFSLIQSPELKEKIFLNQNCEIYKILSKDMLKIEDSKIAYWLNDQFYNSINDWDKINSKISVKKGMSTANDDYYLKYWTEISKNKYSIFNSSNTNKWYPITKGGHYRKWYGNNNYVVNWEDNGRDLKKDPKAFIRSEGFYFLPSLTYGYITVSDISFRFIPKGFLSTAAGPIINQGDLKFFISYLNSKIAKSFIRINTGNKVTYEVGEIQNTIVKYFKSHEIDLLSEKNIEISCSDWNSHETSWDFPKNELLRLKENDKLETSYDAYLENWRTQFFQLHKNEEELNRIFINKYDLQSELTPDVQLKDITIQQEETYINKNNELIFKKDEIIKQFISYSIGCIMGRYSLDKEGLILANQGDTLEQFKELVINPTFMPDEDGIISLMGNNSNFSDDVFIRFKHFLEVAFSPDTLTENINFIQECLDMDLEKFLTEKFWQFHCKMYQKRPIYWLFSSPKGAFKVLIYMHRMNKYTVQKIRNNYLLKHLSYLRNEIARLEKNEQNLSRAEAKQLDKMRSDEIECRDYEKLIKDYSDKQIEFDLDDGVKVNYDKFEGILAAIK